MLKQGYEDALEDFHAARRKAVLEELLAKITGRSNRLISYDEIRVQLGGIETAKRTLQEIPLDSIVGTVSRYQDFNRKLFPLNASDSNRWARVRAAVEESVGLPPIEVYQIGDAYFILDGHHRASIARELGSSHIQAYVREVTTRGVPLSPEDQPDDIILKSEYVDFLKQTRMDDLVPEADLRVSAPGGYEKIMEHISVHRYFQGIDEKRPISYEEAVKHWYRTVYVPVAKIICQRNVLKDFPGRTEADLYLWIMEYRSNLEDELGWKVSPTLVANDLIARQSPTVNNMLRRTATRLASLFPAHPIEPTPPPGDWRKHRPSSEGNGLFDQIQVAVTGDEAGWHAVDFGIQIAKREGAYLEGLHILPDKSSSEEMAKAQKIADEFNARCLNDKVEGALAMDTGPVSSTILEKTAWADLLILRLSFPPPFLSINRLKSGLRNLIRLCRVPLIAVPPSAKPGMDTVLLAYGGGRNADEALFVATYLAKRWNARLVVVTIRRGKSTENALSDRAKKYLEEHDVTNALYIRETGDPPATILKVCKEQNADLILMGGYEGSYLREIVFGSTVDRVLWGTLCPVMICH